MVVYFIYLLYNNCAFVLLRLAIEKVTGTDYRSYVIEKIFKKAGMRNTRFYAMDEIIENAEFWDRIIDEYTDSKYEIIISCKDVVYNDGTCADIISFEN